MKLRKSLLSLLLFGLIVSSGHVVLSQANRQQKQIVPNFSDLKDEIKFYLNEARYTIRDYDLIYGDKEQIDRVQELAGSHKAEFNGLAKVELEGASVDRTKHLVRVLILASSEKAQPLGDLFTIDQLRTTFSKNSFAILYALEYELQFSGTGPQAIYVIEALAAMRNYHAVPLILLTLNATRNRNVERTVASLVDLSATGETFEFFQSKIIEDLCDKSGYGIAKGVELKRLLESLDSLQKNDPVRSARVRAMNANLNFDPDMEALIKFAYESKNERLRGSSVALLATYKSKDSRSVILERLKNDPSKLVRQWAAQSFTTFPDNDPEIVDSLIDAYRTDKEIYVRWGSIESLGKIGGEKAEGVIKEATNDKVPLIKELAARVLKRIDEQKSRRD